MVKIKIFAIVLCLFVLNCSKKTIKLKLPTEELFRISKEYFDEKKYGRAIEGFKKLVFEHPGSELIDEAQFYLAESYFNTKDYENAIVEYRFTIENFQESPFLDDASYKLGLTYYKTSPKYYLDQKRTEEALKIINKFTVRFPESEWIGEAKTIQEKCFDKLSKKELENGKLYYKLGHFESAEIYLFDLLENYPSSSYKDEARFTLALCYKKLGRKIEAEEIFEDLSKKRGKFTRKAKKELEKIAKNKQ
ncbi:MAG: outer membrane protein assembly factor BamD [Candidatus Cloacimonadota bacterium]|nr:MAG: outer membrane protein assembly factor BamD [Candidatus Cloacimonadota bacterium]